MKALVTTKWDPVEVRRHTEGSRSMDSRNERYNTSIMDWDGSHCPVCFRSRLVNIYKPSTILKCANCLSILTPIVDPCPLCSYELSVYEPYPDHPVKYCSRPYCTYKTE